MTSLLRRGLKNGVGTLPATDRAGEICNDFRDRPLLEQSSAGVALRLAISDCSCQPWANFSAAARDAQHGLSVIGADKPCTKKWPGVSRFPSRSVDAEVLAFICDGFEIDGRLLVVSSGSNPQRGRDLRNTSSLCLLGLAEKDMCDAEPSLYPAHAWTTRSNDSKHQGHPNRD